RRLFENVVNETTDDLRSLFADDSISLGMIKEMEDAVIPKLNHMMSIVEKYYDENKHLIRKDYAIKGQQELGSFFSLGMTKYLGRPVNYKEFAIKNYKTFGIKDIELKEEE